MSVDKLVDSTQLNSDLTSVANAIRTKGGTSASLAFPAGFVQAIGDIPSGGGASVDDLLSGAWPSGDITYTLSTNPKDYALANCPSIRQLTIEKKIKPSNYFAQNSSVTSVIAPLVTEISWYAFNGCSSLTNVYFPKLSKFARSIFDGCRFQVGVFPAISGNSDSYTFRNNTALEAIDFGNIVKFQTQVFQSDTVLTVVIIRNPSMCLLDNINTFDNTPFASGKAGGTLYVPNALISSYQSATNWSTILGYTNNQIKSIESTHTDPTAPVDLTLYYADGTPIT